MHWARTARTGTCSSFVARLGVRPIDRVVADLTGRSVRVPVDDELVAGGAAVQAAVIHHGCDFVEIADAWGLGRGETVEPDERVDRLAIRAAYAHAAGGDRS